MVGFLPFRYARLGLRIAGPQINLEDPGTILLFDCTSVIIESDCLKVET